MINILLTLLFFIFFFFIIFIGFLIVFNYFVRMLLRRNRVFSERFYLKEIPFSLDYKTIKRTRAIGEFLGIFLTSAIIFFTFLVNTTPFGVTVQYDLNNHDGNISSLGPANRAQTILLKGQLVTKITDDLIYFTTNMPYMFDSATVKIYFDNSSQNQTLAAGFKDMKGWHYKTSYFDVPFLNNFAWKKMGNNAVLYQKKQIYTSVDTFLNNPPHNSIIGTFNYDTNIGDTSQVHLSNYIPSKQETVISTPLRGKQVLYVYLDKEPFHMIIQKQDLNWYPNPDIMTVNVYKDKDLVYQTSTEDDGITDGSRQIKSPVDVSIDSSGQGFPESGVYKVVINANDDTIIKSISTNLHKIVFANSIFPVSNSNAYSSIVSSTSATTLYTNALSLSALTYHNSGEQIIFVGNQILNLNMLQIPVSIIPPDALNKIIVPQNDVILTAFQGYFAFSPDQFFLPSNYYVMPITKRDDINMVDYILADYLPSHKEDNWQVNEQTFDLSTAYVANNKLSWVIEAPKLKQNNASLIIKDIQITLHKKGWF